MPTFRSDRCSRPYKHSFKTHTRLAKRSPPQQRFTEKVYSYEHLSSILANSSTDGNGSHITRIFVPHRLLCPNPRCTTIAPHAYESLHSIPPCPPNFPQLNIIRFNIETEPGPLTNRWGVETQPSFILQHMMKIYTPIYGIVTMAKMHCGSKSWKGFHLLEEHEDGRFSCVANLYVKKEWCVARARKRSIPITTCTTSTT